MIEIPNLMRGEGSVPQFVQYEIMNAIELRTRVSKRTIGCTSRRETAHQFSVVEDPRYLVSTQRTFEGNRVAAAGLVIEINPESSNRQGFTRP